MQNLFENNSQWAEQVKQEDPGFFDRLAETQTPEYLWIGCADSRVPPNTITGLLPGELFVHRNIANVVVHTDLNSQSVIQYAVQYLKVKHVIVCGHYNCGGVKAAIDNGRLGLIDNWLRHIQDVQQAHNAYQVAQGELHNYLAELNVLEQARNVCGTGTVQDAWERGQELTVHSWIYGLDTGLINNLELECSSPDTVDSCYQSTLDKVKARYL